MAKGEMEMQQMLEVVQRMFPSDSNMDVYAKECVKRYIARQKGEMDDRPLLTEEIRNDARFNDPFPVADDVMKAPGKGQKRAGNDSREQPPLGTRPYTRLALSRAVGQGQ